MSPSVLTFSVLTRATTRMSTLVRQERSVCLLLLHEPCGEGFMWMILKFTSWRIESSFLPPRLASNTMPCPQATTSWERGRGTLLPVDSDLQVNLLATRHLKSPNSHAHYFCRHALAVGNLSPRRERLASQLKSNTSVPCFLFPQWCCKQVYFLRSI